MDIQDLDPGAQLQSMPIHDMIFSFARSIAEAQWAMDKLSVAQVEEMASTMAEEGGSKSLLELGLQPTFYTFEDSILEELIRDMIDQEKRIKEEKAT